MELTITSPSANRALRHAQHLAQLDGRKVPTTLSGAAIQKFCLHSPSEAYFLNRGLFAMRAGSIVIEPDDAVTYEALAKAGVRNFICRYDRDRKICTVRI